MSFKEELGFTGVNHPSYLFSNILKKINFFFHNSRLFQQFFHFNTHKGLQVILQLLELQKQILNFALAQQEPCCLDLCCTQGP